MDSGAKVKPDPRRALPSVDRLLGLLLERRSGIPEWALRAAARRTLDAERARLSDPVQPEVAAPASLVERALAAARALAGPHPARVVNATGISLHTNLGRAPLSEAAIAAVARAAGGYSDLEIDLANGARRSRSRSVEEALCLLTGAAGALVVNNNAAALMLLLAALARGREVIVSRGELVEIGGSFRIPELAAAAGVQLVEVGTTNRTRVEDYADAIGSRSAVLLKVHRSNFEMRGFVGEASLEELARLAAGHALTLVEDLGSGALVDLSGRGFPPESHAPGRLALGADCVCFSADKLLGGPQAGLVLGRDAARMARIGRHPMARALRVDKLTLAALDATLAAYLAGRAREEIPVLGQILEPPESLERRAQALAVLLRAAVPEGVHIEVAPESGYAGGGSLPGFALPSWVVSLRPPGAAGALARALRLATPPVLARVRDARVLLDVRTLLAGDEKAVEAALRQALR